MAHAIDNLRNKIEQLQKTSIDGADFFDPQDIKDLLTREAIALAIRECSIPDHQQPSIADRIFMEGQIVFGILVWKKWQRKIMSFIDRNALDNELPFDVTRAREIVESVGWEFAEKVQWAFLPRMLKKEMSRYHCEFRKEEILPFISETALGEGSFGVVSRVSVLPSLQTFFPQPMSEVFIVRKKLRSANTRSGGKYIEREQECLRILDHLQHPNIVPLLGSYSYRDDYYFLFPEFRIDLEQFLQLEKRFGRFDQDITFYTALQDISSAIKTVHSLNLNTRDHDLELRKIGYHHDIRPANLLVDSTTFYLSDFGLARMKPGDEESATRWKTGLGDYIAPECMDERLLHREVGRPLDIWSFGCMIWEIAAYIKGGPGGVLAFRNQRCGPGSRPEMEDALFFRGRSLRESVILWFESLKARSETVLCDLLEEAKLMLNIDPRDRPKAVDVHRQLSFLSVKVLFGTVRQALTLRVESAREIGALDPSITTVQLENTRLAAWGKVLQLTGGNTSADMIAIVSGNGKFFRHMLTSILEKLDSHAVHDEAKKSSRVTFIMRKPLHEELQELIENLWNPLPTRHREKLRQVWLEDSLASDKGVRDTVHSVGSSTLPDRYSELRDLALTKLENMRLKTAQSGTPKSRDSEDRRASLLLNSNQLHLETQFDEGLSIAQYQHAQVFVEWVSHTEKWNKMSGPEKRERMQLMAEVFHRCSMPRGFGVLDCIGFVDPTAHMPDPLEYGFVYVFPKCALEPSTERRRFTPISLCDIITKRNKHDIPLGARFRLAYRLVSSVRELHMVRWIHKNINSRNVVFFEENDRDRNSALSDLLENPYLINFRYSRPSAKVCQSEMPVAGNDAVKHFQHPEYSAGECHFREIYDYYSVGVVLLEIGGWTPLESYLRHNQNLVSDPSAFRNILIDKYAPRLKALMGVTYANATLACLLCNFGRDNMRTPSNEEEQTVLGEFHDKVVSPLGELAGCPL